MEFTHSADHFSGREALIGKSQGAFEEPTNRGSRKVDEYQPQNR